MKTWFCIAACSILAAWDAAAKNSFNEAARITAFPAATRSAGMGSIDIDAVGKIRYDGVGLGSIDFAITRNAIRLKKCMLSIEVYDPSGNAIWRTDTEMLGWQLWKAVIVPGAACRLLPLATPGRYTYKYWTDRQPVREGAVDYYPRCRMKYVKMTRGGKVNILMKERAGHDPDEDRTVVQGIGDYALKHIFFWENLANGEKREYKLETDGRTSVTFSLPGLYTIEVWPNSVVWIVEKRDESLPLIGYKYFINAQRGQYSAKREKLGNPPGVIFNVNHRMRKPYERWVIWAAERMTAMDKGFAHETGKQAARDWLGNKLEEYAAVWGIGMTLSGGPTTWHVSAVETSLGGMWMGWMYTDFMSRFKDLYAVPRSAAIRNETPFIADPNTHLDVNQKTAARMMFNLVLSAAQGDYSPSYQRALEAIEWGYELAWLYGDLYIPNNPGDSALTKEQAPPEMLTRLGLLQFKAKKGAGSFIPLDLVWQPSGTEWSGAALGRFAFAVSNNTVWVMDEDGTDCRQVAAAASGRIVGQIAWSKDATRLAYTAWRTDADGYPARGEVWTVKADGTDHRRLIEGDPPATNALDDADHPWSLFTRDYFSGPDFSPNGSQIAVQRYQCFEDRDTNDESIARLAWEDVETILLPTAGGSPQILDDSHWTRYQPFWSNRVYSAPESSAPYAFATAWSAQDELLWPRCYEPQLSAGSVTPNGGFADLTPFTFEFIFWDTYNQPPKQALLHLNNQDYPMSFRGFVHGPSTEWGDYRHGAIYTCTNTLPPLNSMSQSNDWFGVQTWNDGWIWFAPSLNSWPVRHALSNVGASLTDPANASAWGQYEYEFTADYVDASHPGAASPWLLLEAPGAAGMMAIHMTLSSGNTHKKRVTLPLAYAAGQTTTNTIRYWITAHDPDGASGPYSIKVSHAWPAKPWLSSTGGVYVTSSLSKTITHTNDVNGDGTNEVVTITVSGGISATRGRSADTFLYRARYYNSYNLAAVRAGVVIDGGEHAMTYVGAAGSDKIYEYETTLAAAAAKHQWQLVFADAYATCQTGTTNEPWVVDAQLGSPTSFRSGNREYTFRVQAHQTAGTGKVFCIITSPTGRPRCIQPMTRVSGSLDSWATYELVATPDKWAVLADKNGSSTTSGGVNPPALGLISFGYSFVLMDDFDRYGSALAPMNAYNGAKTASQSYSCYLRHDDYNTWQWQRLLTMSGDHVQRSPPGRGAIEPAVGLTCARGGLAWSPDGSRLAVAGGTNLVEGLMFFTNQGGGVFAPLARASNFAYAALSGWHTPESVFVAYDPEPGPGGWQYGRYDMDVGLFLEDSTVGAPLLAAGKSPFMPGRFSTCYSPLNAWVVSTPPALAKAVCSEGEVQFGETNATTVYVAERQLSRYDTTVGDTQPQPPESVNTPLVLDRACEGPSAAGGLLPGASLWQSALTILPVSQPGDVGFPACMGRMVTATPTLRFSMSHTLMASSAADLWFSLSRAGETSVFENTLGILAFSGKVSYAVSGSNLAIAVAQALENDTYLAELSLGGLSASGGGTVPAGSVSGWFSITKGPDNAGGEVALEDSGARVLIPAGAFSGSVDVTLAIPPDGLGDDPTDHLPMRSPLAVAWTPAGAPATNLWLIFDQVGSDGFAGAEPAMGLWTNSAWQIRDVELSDDGGQIRFGFASQGIYRLYRRPRGSPDLRAWLVTGQDSAAPGAELDVQIEVRQVAGGPAANAWVRLIIAPDADYVNGSASDGGVYHAGTHAVEWRWTNLYAGSQRHPTCCVRAGVTNRNLGLQVNIGASNATERAITLDPLQIATQVAVEVSANLAQAAYQVTGPGGRFWAGSGFFWRMENQPPGEYRAVFLTVAGYGLLPGARTQSCTVAAGATARFQAAFFTDQDQDGLDDSWELDHAPDLTVLSGAGDADGDRFDDLSEWQATTDPRDPKSLLEFVGAAIVSNAAVGRFTWSSQAGVQYAVQYSTNLMFGFHTVTNLLATPPQNAFTNPPGMAGQCYRVWVPSGSDLNY